MNCNRCNRLLIANDARIVDAQDSAARVELHCECGAVHSAFIDDGDWIYGLAGENTHGRICTRQWCRTVNGVIRWLAVSDYGPCEYDESPREFMYRLPLNDPRPWGNQMSRMNHLADWFDGIPFGSWVETTPDYKGADSE